MSIHCARNCALELFFTHHQQPFSFTLLVRFSRHLQGTTWMWLAGGLDKAKLWTFPTLTGLPSVTQHPFVWLRLFRLFANSLDKRQIKQSVICKGKNIVFCTKAACVIFFGKPGKHMDRATWRMRKAIAFKQQMSQCRRKRYRHDLQVNISAQSHPVNRPRWSLQARGKI